MLAANTDVELSGSVIAGIAGKESFHALYFKDGIHPSKFGTYLEACVIASSLSGLGPALRYAHFLKGYSLVPTKSCAFHQSSCFAQAVKQAG